LAVKINGNRGAQQDISVSTTVSKEIMPFKQKLPIQECDTKNDPTGHPESESDKKIRLRLQLQFPMLLGIRLRLHPKTSDSLRLPLRNLGFKSRNNG